VEKTNRYLTAIAAAKLAWDSGAGPVGGREFARQTVNATQNENARWNTPEWVRGRKGALFPFMKYIMNTVGRFAFFNDPAALRWWIAMVAAAGVTGVPFAEDVLELLDGILTQAKQRLGLKDPFVDLSADLHKMFATIGTDPEVVMHGAARDSFGASYYADKAGLPYPSFDISGAMGFGNILPGTRTVRDALQGRQMTGAEFAGSFMAESGATAANIFSAIGGMVGDDPDTWKRAETGMPKAFSNFSKALRASKQGGLYSKDGRPLMEVDSQDPVHRAELYGMAFGFPPTRLTESLEVQQWQRRASTYYQTRYRTLLEDINFAAYNGDREAYARAMKAKDAFNRTVPYPRMRISPETLSDSKEAYFKARKERELGRTGDPKTFHLEKSYEGLQGEVRQGN
jgi:hypothetical protein